VPTRFVPHGDPKRILARLGLDADGITAAVRTLRP
jgi:deoxyxylulose-5-phosphate synthase